MKIEDRSCNRNMTLDHRDTWIDMICKLQSCSKLKSVKGLQNETGRVLKWHIQTGPFDNITLTDAIRYLQPGFLTTIRNRKKYDMEAMHETTFVLRLDVAVSDLQLYFHIESINQQLDLNEKVEFVSVRKSLLWLSAPSISYHPNC